MEEPGTHGSASRAAKAFSCVRCFERKVKCDKQSPCTNCMRSNAECLFRVPPAPRRRKKRTQEEILKARLDRYEQLFRAKGIDIRAENDPGAIEADEDLQDLKSTPDDKSSTQRSASFDGTKETLVDTGRLVINQGRADFVENQLWTSVSEELQRLDAFPNSSDDEAEGPALDDNADFVLGLTSAPSVRDLQPSPNHILKYWQIFLDNFNPLTKIVHAPTVQAAILDACSNLDKVDKNIEALMFAIYSAAVLTLDDEECLDSFGEARKALLLRFRSATKIALARAKFIGTTELIVLQALVIHLIATRDGYDARTLWTLAGVACRISEGMGVHRDGESLGLGPFETELRRRLWWQTTTLDIRSAEMKGSGNMGQLKWDVKLPLNVNDADIYPGMTEKPDPQHRKTEMIFCLLRYEVGTFWKSKLMKYNGQLDISEKWKALQQTGTAEDKLKDIDELEAILEAKYVRFCDPAEPVEFAASLVARAATNSMRMMACHPRRYSRPEDVPEAISQKMWSLSMKLVEVDNMIHASQTLRGFGWHMEYFFQWHALIYLLGELKTNPNHEQADKAWKHIHGVFERHPNFVKDHKRPIHSAVGSLCSKAFAAKEEIHASKSPGYPLRIPEYIKVFRQRQQKNKRKPIPPHGEQMIPANPDAQMEANHAGHMLASGLATSSQQPLLFQNKQQPIWQNAPAPQTYGWGQNMMATNNNVGMDFLNMQDPMQDTPMDWSQWDSLLQDFQAPTPSLPNMQYNQI